MGEPAWKYISYEEYAELEEGSEVKHEWIDGQMIPMAAVTLRHGQLQTNLTVALVTALGRRPCRVLPSDVRNRVQATGLGTYPDLSVVCGRPVTDPRDVRSLVNPTVLFEVLSQTTESYDRGEKFRHYQKMPSLQEFVLVNQDRIRMERYRRAPEGGWHYALLESGETLELSSIGVSLSLDVVYEGVFELPGSEPDVEG